MKTWRNWRPRERTKTRGISNWRTREIHNAGNGKGIFFIWEGTASLWGIGPKCRMVHEGCSSCSECNPVLPCYLRQEKKRHCSDITDSFFSRGWIESNLARNQNLGHQCQTCMDCSLSSISYCWWSFSCIISHLFHSVPILVYLHGARPAPVCQLLYHTNVSRPCTITWKMVIFSVCFFMYFLCEKYYKQYSII